MASPIDRFVIVNPSDALFFTGTKRIAVETWALDWGQHEFDYEVNSRRADPDGRPEAIATTRRTLEREFLERRVVTRQPIPISVGFPNGAVPKVQMTMGEVTPQVYESRVPGTTVARSVRFKTHRLAAAATGTMAAGKNAIVRNRNAASIGRATVAGQAMPSGFDYLMVRVPVAEFTRFRILRQGFGVTVLIGEEPGLIQRWIARITETRSVTRTFQADPFETPPGSRHRARSGAVYRAFRAAAPLGSSPVRAHRRSCRAA